MRTPILRRRGLAVGAMLLLTFGLLLCATAARAAPGTVSGQGVSVTVSNTTPAPGETITISESYTSSENDEGAFAASIGFGDESGGDSAVNLADLSFVDDSCTGDFSSCFYYSGSPLAFVAAVPEGDNGVVSGSAQFTVSPSASDGETISFFGFHRTVLESVVITSTAPVSVLTVTANADLGVSLSATAGAPLSRSVNYDAAVTNNGPAAATSATITTQLSSHATSIASTGCTFSSTTHKVTCPIGALANGATTHATFTAYFGLLTFGLPLNATATRSAGSPADPNSSNDSDGASCTALTGLIISC